MNKSTLLVIDAQNDYLATGRFPLWNMDNTLENIQLQISKFNDQQNSIILIQHISPPKAPFFEKDTTGVNIIPEILDKPVKKTIIQKTQGDAFLNTNLENFLKQEEISTLYICGMMSQHCVLFTSLAAKSKGYSVNIIANACTSVSPIIHKLALNGLSNLVNVI